MGNLVSVGAVNPNSFSFSFVLPLAKRMNFAGGAAFSQLQSDCASGGGGILTTSGNFNNMNSSKSDFFLPLLESLFRTKDKTKI